MYILSIETSCDETSISVVQDTVCKNRILSLVTRSQVKEHQDYGGVVPELAARAHLTNIEPIFNQAINQSGITLKDIDAIAVTAGPGLIGGVLVGVMLAKSLSISLNKPLYGINHLEGHALTARLSNDTPYPYLLLLTSGGHCMFVEVLGFRQYKLLGQTLDDAAGECFDKIAKLLDFDFPGGPALEKKAALGNQKRFIFPMPLKHSAEPNFSFSGLKTAVKLEIERNIQSNQSGYRGQAAVRQDYNSTDTPRLDRGAHDNASHANLNMKVSDETACDIAASFQFTVGEIFKERTAKALECSKHKVERLVMAGGVAANQYLRGVLKQLCEERRIEAIFPPMHLCTDNAAMIGWAAIEAIQNLVPPTEIDFQPKPRWPLQEINFNKK